MILAGYGDSFLSALARSLLDRKDSMVVSAHVGLDSSLPERFLIPLACASRLEALLAEQSDHMV